MIQNFKQITCCQMYIFSSFLFLLCFFISFLFIFILFCFFIYILVWIFIVLFFSCKQFVNFIGCLNFYISEILAICHIVFEVIFFSKQYICFKNLDLLIFALCTVSQVYLNEKQAVFFDHYIVISDYIQES